MSFKENTINDITFMTASNISTTHGFSTRSGSVRRALDIIEDDIVCLRQVHSTNVFAVGTEHRGKALKPSAEGDALLTNQPNVALVVFTADCVPILLHDPVKNVIGAVHAGWRGTANDIMAKAVEKMKEEYDCSPSDIKAAIGPCISKCCYETGKDVADVISSYEYTGGKYMVDLKEANRISLINSGVTDIEISDDCTSCKNDKYWSHRVAGTKRGIQAAIITLTSHTPVCRHCEE